MKNSQILSLEGTIWLCTACITNSVWALVAGIVFTIVTVVSDVKGD